MSKLITAFAIFLITIGSLNAQFFNISSIETDKFPWVSTIFVAKDGDNEFIKNATINQFSIEEDGIFVPFSKMKIECFESQDVPELSIVIVVDKSGSMEKPFDDKKPNETPWQKVREGVEAFLNTIKFVGRTEASLVAFSNDSFLGCPFTNDPQQILDSLDEIIPNGATRYDPPFIKPEYILNGQTRRESATSLLRERPANMKRIVVFLTDGAPTSPPNTLEIIDSLNYYNITAYNISFLTNMDPSLNEIATQTNGRAYMVEKKEDLVHIYTEIAIEAQKAYFCELSWLTDYPCYDTQRDRTAEITFKGISPFGRGTRSYVIPERFIPNRTWDKKTYSFGNPEVGSNNSVIKQLQLVIGKVDFKLDDIAIVPDNQGFKINSVKNSAGLVVNNNSTILEGDTLFIEVEFEQFGTKTLRTATLTANGTPCLTASQLVGGTTDIILESPNGGNVFTVCDNININWNGVEPGTDVHISYSKDSFSKDSNFIATSTGTSYNWNKNPGPGNYKVKLRVDPEARYIYALNEKSSGKSHGSSIALSRDELFTYSTGHYNDTIKFDNTVLTNKGNTDIFLAKHNSAGKLIWANSLGGDGLDSASGVCVDDQEQVYITGATTKGAKFGSSVVNTELGGSAFFIAKTTPNGGTYTVRTISARSPYTTFEAWGTKIRYDQPTDRIIVQFGTKNDLENLNPQYSFKANTVRYTAIYDKSLNPITIFEGWGAGDFSSDTDVTADKKSTYKIGTMSSDKTFGPFNLKHSGKSDVYITRYGENEPSEDVSETSFTIEKPVLAFSETGPIVFNDTPINDVNAKSLAKFVINQSLLPIEIDSVYITGTNKDEFTLDKTFDGIIESGVANAKDMFINFNPQTSGPKTAILNVKGECTDLISIVLNGNGICDLVTTNEINFGATNLNLTSNRTDVKVFYNNNNVPVRITPQIINDNDNEFKIISINDDTGLVGTSINVEPKDSVKVELSFTPVKEGNKTATLSFNSETDGCTNVVTKLIGTGANTDLSYAIVDFGRKRIKTVSKLDLEIVNSGNLDVKLTSISLANNNAFTIEQTSDLLIPSKGSKKYEITFNPQTDGNYSVPINIVINPNDSPISLNNVIGIGENPTAIGSIDCGNSNIQNTTSSVDLILTNTSTVATTKVTSITISPTSNYTFVGGLKTYTTVPDIAINNNITIPLEFTPLTAGLNKLVYTIVSNTAIGNNINDEVEDPLTRIDTLECNAIQSSGADQVEFVGVLVCDEHRIDLSIPNNDPNSSVTIDRVELTPSGTDFFLRDLPSGSFDISAGNNYPFKVAFQPDTEGLQTAKVTVYYTTGTTKEYILTGTGKRIRYFTNQSEIDVIPGSEITLTVMAEIPTLSYDISELDVILQHNPDITAFITNNNGFIFTPISNNINWTWSNNTNKNSQQNITFEGMSNTQADWLINGTTHELFDIKYKMYLGPNENDNIKVADFPNCLNQSFSQVQKVNISGVCALDKRLIEIGLIPEESFSQFDANLNIIKTNFTVMYDNLDVNIEVIDINGNVVTNQSTSNLNQGHYESAIDANAISSGLYFVRINSGAYSTVNKLMIIK
jgi:von Willebrand factor type A domain-containing protein/type IX secretion system substrate protein/HYDIN/CFA65/VesB family protein